MSQEWLANDGGIADSGASNNDGSSSQKTGNHSGTGYQVYYDFRCLMDHLAHWNDPTIDESALPMLGHFKIVEGRVH